MVNQLENWEQIQVYLPGVGLGTRTWNRVVLRDGTCLWHFNSSNHIAFGVPVGMLFSHILQGEIAQVSYLHLEYTLHSLVLETRGGDLASSTVEMLQ